MLTHINKLDRRNFLKGVGALTASAFILPRFSIAKGSANEKVNVAFIGAGGRAEGNVPGFAKNPFVNIVAFADVDDRQSANMYGRFPDVPKFRDYRKMLDKMGKDIDAVCITTPDHTHHSIAMECMRRGKHVYVEKPMAHDIWEVREMCAYAKENKIVTQMGNHCHASQGIRVGAEWVAAGVIGKVKEIQVWNQWPISSEATWYAQLNGKEPQSAPVPEELDWEIWLGPLRFREYSPAYLPRTWRTFYEMGNGILGDWGCHTIDAASFAMQLGAPSRVEAVEYKTSDIPDVQNYSNVTSWSFPARKGFDKIKMTWYDGFGQEEHLRCSTPPGSENFQWDPSNINGCLLVGEKGDIYFPGHPTTCRIYPRDLFVELKRDDKLPEASLPRAKGDIYADFVAGIKGECTPCSNFENAKDLTEIVLLGTLAQKTRTSFDWDPVKCKTSSKEANAAMEAAKKARKKA